MSKPKEYFVLFNQKTCPVNDYQLEDRAVGIFGDSFYFESEGKEYAFSPNDEGEGQVDLCLEDGSYKNNVGLGKLISI